ncbi:MAG: hypothetical protein Q4D39_02880 [Coriobacteriaceae bacterium]|nr:hypothetical protein [Coriobacteriaceae bacterium]
MGDMPLGKKIITSIIILVIAVAVIIGIAIVFGMIGIPLWPFIMFLFLYSGLDNFDASKLPWTALSGAIGIFSGMAQGMFGEITGNPTIGMVAFALSAGALACAYIMGGVKWANLTGLLLMTVLTLFSFEPSALAGVAEATWVGAFVRSMASYLIAVVVFVIVGKVTAGKAAAAQAGDSQE